MDSTVQRRWFVRAVSGAAAVGIAGCLEGDGEEDDHSHDDENHSHDDDNDDGGSEAAGSEGLLYAFGPNTIALIDPEEGEVVDEIAEGIDGYEYGDAVVTRDRSQLFVIEETLAQVLVIDTETREIVSEVGMGPDGTHMYHPNDGEMWAHADAEGTFYVIDTESHEVTEIVEAGLENEGHGKLLYHEDFGSKGYGTNVNDPAALIIDLDSYERTDHVELGDEGGTHYKAYSPRNGLAYFERSGGVGTTAIVDVETDEIIGELDVSGGMYLTPDEERMGIIDGDAVHFFDVTTEDTEAIGTVEVEGGPDALAYHEVDDTLYGFTANTTTPDAAVIDVDALEEVDRIDAGDIERPEGAQFLHRSGVAGGGYFFTPAGAEGTVAVIDMEARDLVAQVPVEEGIDAVQYVGEADSGR